MVRRRAETSSMSVTRPGRPTRVAERSKESSGTVASVTTRPIHIAGRSSFPCGKRAYDAEPMDPGAKQLMGRRLRAFLLRAKHFLELIDDANVGQFDTGPVGGTAD